MLLLVLLVTDFCVLIEFWLSTDGLRARLEVTLASELILVDDFFASKLLRPTPVAPLDSLFEESRLEFVTVAVEVFLIGLMRASFLTTIALGLPVLKVVSNLIGVDSLSFISLLALLGPALLLARRGVEDLAAVARALLVIFLILLLWFVKLAAAVVELVLLLLACLLV